MQRSHFLNLLVINRREPLRRYGAGERADLVEFQDLGETAERQVAGDGHRELDDLALVEVAAQVGEGGVVDAAVVGGEQLGVLDGRPLGVAVEVAGAVLVDVLVKVLGDALLRARRSPIRQSVGAVVDHRDLVAQQLEGPGRERRAVGDGGVESGGGRAVRHHEGAIEVTPFT